MKREGRRKSSRDQRELIERRLHKLKIPPCKISITSVAKRSFLKPLCSDLVMGHFCELTTGGGGVNVRKLRR